MIAHIFRCRSMGLLTFPMTHFRIKSYGMTHTNVKVFALLLHLLQLAFCYRDCRCRWNVSSCCIIVYRTLACKAVVFANVTFAVQALGEWSNHTSQNKNLQAISWLTFACARWVHFHCHKQWSKVNFTAITFRFHWTWLPFWKEVFRDYRILYTKY